MYAPHIHFSVTECNHNSKWKVDNLLIVVKYWDYLKFCWRTCIGQGLERCLFCMWQVRWDLYMGLVLYWNCRLGVKQVGKKEPSTKVFRWKIVLLGNILLQTYKPLYIPWEPSTRIYGHVAFTIGYFRSSDLTLFLLLLLISDFTLESSKRERETKLFPTKHSAGYMPWERERERESKLLIMQATFIIRKKHDKTDVGGLKSNNNQYDPLIF